jgi:hypothetical protein
LQKIEHLQKARRGGEVEKGRPGEAGKPGNGDDFRIIKIKIYLI